MQVNISTVRPKYLFKMTPLTDTDAAMKINLAAARSQVRSRPAVSSMPFIAYRSISIF